MLRHPTMIRLIALLAAVVLIASCTLPFLPPPTPTLSPGMGGLSVNIDYTGTWYRETFEYSRQAENIRHYVLMMPASEVDRARAGAIFTSLQFPENPGDERLRPDRADVAWALDDLYEAPEGHFRGEFEPGTYYLAVAFIAAPLSREEAEVGEDAVLYAGITGGGASTDYQEIAIEAGKWVDLTVTMTDANGWACPWLYVYNGHAFERRTEILRGVRGPEHEQTEISPLGMVPVIDGIITLRIAEEKDEITYLDALYLIVNGAVVRAEPASDASARIAETDQNYLIITRGESIEFRFQVPDARGQVPMTVVAAGYYLPLE
jgi:hypothetical protein